MNVKSASWVIVDSETGQAVMETFSEGMARAVNEPRFRAVPILEWLASLNKPAK